MTKANKIPFGIYRAGKLVAGGMNTDMLRPVTEMLNSKSGSDGIYILVKMSQANSRKIARGYSKST